MSDDNGENYFDVYGDLATQIQALREDNAKLASENEKLKKVLESIAFECCLSMRQNNQAIARQALKELESKGE